jgi:hypothetical protein
MTRALFSSLILAASLAWAPEVGATESPSETSTGQCQEPVPLREYDGNVLTYGLQIDLNGCDWWDGAPIQLVADLSRLDGLGEHGSTAFVLCGGFSTPADGGTTRPQRSERATCAVVGDIEHPSVDLALYRGETTYPWSDGDRTVSFEAV